MSTYTRMESSQSESPNQGQIGSTTLADILCFLPDPSLREELEAYRIKFESRFGETDITKRYTSCWPPDQQEWLLDNHPRKYYDGLPLFAKAFFKDKMMQAQRNGRLDDMPAPLLRIYLSGQMEVNGEGYNR